ncbi:MAG: carboxylesterase [Gammaproteobacteria bacterium]|nr:carboxylesterase [Gammaproteobacteria bacterium]MCY4357593.1 carboxylesterase [Gammaproteobacteria bacterium]
MEYLPTVETDYPPDSEVSASVIWLHGLGADGNDFAPIVPQLGLSGDYGVRFVFPHAPSMSVTINNGYVMPAWYDIRKVGMESHADEVQLRQSAHRVHDLIGRELERGISAEQIVIAGFSQGGAVALEAALSYPKPLAGIMALSTYFPTADSIEIQLVQNTLPILICHGISDPMVPETLGRKSVAILQNLGFNPEYETYSMEHAVCPQQIRDIGSWLQRTLKI